MTNTLTISLIVRNEEKSLGRCLESVAGLGGEIVVVDTGSLTYAYDNSGQLTGVSGARTETYTFDANGNRSMSGYVYGTGNIMTADAAGNTFSYDGNGNRTGKTDTAGNVWVYPWDYRHRLIEGKETNI